MAFIPMVPPPPAPSARARDLANRLAEVVATFQRQYPGTSREDIRQAVRLATQGERDVQRPRMAVALGVLGMLVAGIVSLLASKGAGAMEGTVPVVAIGIVAAVVAMMVALRRRDG
jgi:phosphotransferase system  glucose/maltose/N-acetylglucosamine-specific IIC component